MKAREEAALLLARHAAAGNIELQRVQPALKDLLAPSQAELSFAELLEALRPHELPEVRRLRSSLHRFQLEEAGRFFDRRWSDPATALTRWPVLAYLPLPPAGWRDQRSLPALARLLGERTRDLFFLRDRVARLPQISPRIEAIQAKALRDLRQQPGRWTHMLPEVELGPESLQPFRQEVRGRIERRVAAALDNAPAPPDPELDEEVLFEQLVQRFQEVEGDQPAGRDLLDLALCWPTDRLAEALPLLAREDWARERARVMLVLRFGQPRASWKRWKLWLDRQREHRERWTSSLRAIRRAFADELLLIWYEEQADPPDPEILGELIHRARERAAEMGPAAFVSNWRDLLTPREVRSLLGGDAGAVEAAAEVAEELDEAREEAGTEEALAAVGEAGAEVAGAEVAGEEVAGTEAVAAVETEAVAAEAEEAEPEAVAELAGVAGTGAGTGAGAGMGTAAIDRPSPAPARPAEARGRIGEREPPPSSVWHDHIQPYLVENWYLVAGLAMVLVGASLLAYFTWDTHWILRYTIMPSLLVLFTHALPFVAGKLEKRADELRSTALLLRGAAIALVPVNFMIVALLILDRNVTSKTLAIPVVVLVYLGLFGFSLSRWCRAVHPELTWLGGLTLLGLDALICLLPIADLTIGGRWGGRTAIVGTGAYLGFVLIAVSATWFLRRVLDRELLEGRFVPWFFGLAVAGTFVEALAIVHWTLWRVPSAEMYALMVVLAGGLVIFTERRSFQLRSAEPGYGGESFLGYALVLLGVLLSLASPELRVAALLLAGTVWLFQASLRQGSLQYWIGLTLLMLGAGAVSLLDGFPVRAELNLLPALGLGAALGVRLLRAGAVRYKRERLAHACDGFLPGLLLLTVVVGALSQWHVRSAPWQIGALLVLVGGLLIWRALRTGLVGWAYTAMAVLTVAVPYLGCVDMRGHALYGNNLVFGLGVLGALWLAALRIWPVEPLIRARSTAIFSLGVLALTAMLIRVVFERDTSGFDLLAFRAWLDVTGPMLMAAVLLSATYHSRSMIPLAMAAVIGAVLAPELKESLRVVLPQITWGSGLGSSIAALALVAVCFPLRRWDRLADLGPGDPFFGEAPFPWRRTDHTLFTWPLLATALFLAVKVDTYNLVRNLAGEGLGVRTAVALGLTAACWTLLAAAMRNRIFGWIAAHLTLINLVLFFVFIDIHIDQRIGLQWSFVFTGLVLDGLVVLYGRLARRFDWAAEVLLGPAAAILREGCWIAASAVTFLLLIGPDPAPLSWLGAFLGAHLIWYAVREGTYRHGIVLFILGTTALLAWVSPGDHPLPFRLSLESSLIPLLVLGLALHAAHLVLELSPSGPQGRLRSLDRSLMGGVVALAVSGALLALGFMVGGEEIELTPLQQALTVALVLATARVLVSAEAVVVAAVLAYIFWQTGELAGVEAGGPRLVVLLRPWLLAAFGLELALLPYAGQQLRRIHPNILRSRLPLGSSPLRAVEVIFPLAMFLAVAASIYAVADPRLRHQSVQLWAPYLAAATLVLAGLTWRALAIFGAAGLALALGNVMAIERAAGESPETWGLSHIHLVCLGLFATVVQMTLLRLAARAGGVRQRLDEVAAVARQRLGEGCLILAGTLLVLLSLDYFAHPDLASVSWQRFLISGVMAYLAGLYFRFAARSPELEGSPWWGVGLEGVYHFGLVVALWCLALLIPWLRTPGTVLIAIALPALYFYARAEYGWRQSDEAAREHGERYPGSATVLSFLLIALYTLKGIFLLILFPETPMDTAHYHLNSPVLILSGLLLLRLRGLGATSWTGVYAGLALAAGAYFGVTAYPGLSPFGHPIAAAWVVVVMGHFFIVAGAQRSPLRSVIQEIGRISGPDWVRLRTIWGHVLLIAAQVVILLGLIRTGAHRPLMLAPLLAGSASLFLHQGVAGGIRAYSVIFGVLVALALHLDFLAQSYLGREHVVWVILGLWAVLLLGDRLWVRGLSRRALFLFSTGSLAATLAHVVFHLPWSVPGLAAMALAGLLWASTPTEERYPASVLDGIAAGLVLIWPPWLVYFGQVYAAAEGGWGLARTWPVLCLIAALHVLGWVGWLCQTRWAEDLASFTVKRTRLFRGTLALLAERGLRLWRVLMWVATVMAAAVQIAHGHAAYSGSEVSLLVLVWIGLAAAWLVEARGRPGVVPQLLAEASLMGLYLLGRTQIALTTPAGWSPEFDVWASLAVAALLTGAHAWIDRQERPVRLTLLCTLFTMPVAALGWIVWNGLEANVTLVVVGLHTLLFLFLGRGSHRSKYHIVSVCGAVAFVILLFWTKLELRVFQAYVIPAGLGVLVLIQLFERDIPRPVRNGVRLVVLLVMLGVAGYYALLDTRYPVAFNLTLILLGLVAMVVGSLLRVRLYLVLGLLGILVDLGSILHGAVVQMESAYRWTVVGSLLLLVGIGVVGGSVYYKARSEAIEARIARLRKFWGRC